MLRSTVRPTPSEHESKSLPPMQPLPCTSGITDMSNLFNPGGTSNANPSGDFNGDISHWDTSDVTRMDSMFHGAGAFNRDIGDWDTGMVTTMNRMFRNASVFNQDIGDWDTSRVTNMREMFRSADAFNQNLSGWCVTNITYTPTAFSTDSALTAANHPVWGTCPTP